MNLGSDLEASIWLIASRVYRQSLHQVVGHAVAQYRRCPGLDGLTRLHTSMAGIEGVNALAALSPSATLGKEGEGYVEIRHHLRWHIVRHLQRRLISDGHATDEMRDDLFGTDLGL